MDSRLISALLASVMLHVSVMEISAWGVSHAGRFSQTTESTTVAGAKAVQTLRVSLRRITPSLDTSQPLEAISIPAALTATAASPDAAALLKTEEQTAELPAQGNPAPPPAESTKLMPEQNTQQTAGVGGRSPELKSGTFDADVEFWPASELDFIARPIHPVDFADPTLPNGPMIDGKIRMVLYLDERGIVVRADVEGDDVPGDIADALKQQFTSIQFFPAERHNRKVKSFKLIEICISSCSFAQSHVIRKVTGISDKSPGIVVPDISPSHLTPQP